MTERVRVGVQERRHHGARYRRAEDMMAGLAEYDTEAEEERNEGCGPNLKSGRITKRTTKPRCNVCGR